MTAHPILRPAAAIVAGMDQAATGQRSSAGTALETAMVELVESNLRQWDLEDATRDPAASDGQVAKAKRQIDRLNVSRHRLVEEIDAAIDSGLDQPATAPLATESPGMVLDRLSVLVIRRAPHGRGRPGATRSSPSGSGPLEAQVGALSAALDSYMDELYGPEPSGSYDTSPSKALRPFDLGGPPGKGVKPVPAPVETAQGAATGDSQVGDAKRGAGEWAPATVAGPGTRVDQVQAAGTTGGCQPRTEPPGSHGRPPPVPQGDVVGQQPGHDHPAIHPDPGTANPPPLSRSQS